jgi:hypothetical protein
MDKNLKEYMRFTKEGKKFTPLFVSEINGRFIVAAYQGSLSKYDILIKYRQKIKGKWSYIRTPKHIHWAVDVLIKMHEDPKKTKEFINFLLSIWEKTRPMKSGKQRKTALNLGNLLEINRAQIEKYKKLGEKGEYSIKFLILLAKLLMLQEKTNLETAYMFKNLLKALHTGEDIFKIVSIATHNRR